LSSFEAARQSDQGGSAVLGHPPYRTFPALGGLPAGLGCRIKPRLPDSGDTHPKGFRKFVVADAGQQFIGCRPKSYCHCCMHSARQVRHTVLHSAYNVKSKP
jgi:hypothetical protein